MRYLILFLTLFTLMFGSVQAGQVSRWKSGIKGGASFSKLVSNYSFFSERKFEFQMGFFSSRKLSDRHELVFEVLFSDRGAKGEVDGILFDTTIGYMQIPLLYKVKAKESIYIYAGPYIAYLTEAMLNIQVGNQKTLNDVTSLFTGSDAGMILGLGFDVADNWFAEVRVTKGLVDINQRTKLPESVRNESVDFSVRYKI